MHEAILQTATGTFILALLGLSLAMIVYGWCLSCKAPRFPQKHWLAYRRVDAGMSAEEQAEQIIRAVWPEEVL